MTHVVSTPAPAPPPTAPRAGAEHRSSRWSRSLRLNPVLERELRERPRTLGSVVMLTIYLAMLVGVFVLVYLVAKYSTGNQAVTATLTARLGRELFEWVLFVMLLLVLFLVPGYTAAAITGERERQTLIPMQLTLLSPARIVSGKVYASIAYLAMLVVATMPILALAYMIGGVSLWQIVRGIGAVLLVGFVAATVAVACSCLVRRVASATVLAYAFGLLIISAPAPSGAGSLPR